MAGRLQPVLPQLPLELVGSYNNIDTQHFSYQGEALTICGRNRENWMTIRFANLKEDVDSAWTCRHCVRKLES